MSKVAIVVGHSRQGDKGAYSVGGVSEWDFNNDIADLIAANLAACHCDIQPRVWDEIPKDTYGGAMTWLGEELEIWGADVAIELHFNSASETAQGYEYIYSGSDKGRDLAQHMLDAMDRFGSPFPNRGIKTPVNGRGSGFLNCSSAISCILEPFFGSNYEEWQHWSTRKSVLSDLAASGVREYLVE